MPHRVSPGFPSTHTMWSILRHPGTVWALRASNERLVTAQDLPDLRADSNEGGQHDRLTP